LYTFDTQKLKNSPTDWKWICLKTLPGMRIFPGGEFFKLRFAENFSPAPEFRGGEFLTLKQVASDGFFASRAFSIPLES
jgi:hypothetical protein